MGLALEVGMLADMKQNDPEGYQQFKADFEKVDRILHKHNIEGDYKEPDDLSESQIWSCELYGYTGLHYLRRLAAHLWYQDEKVLPGDEQASEDPVIETFYKEYISTRPKRRMFRLLSSAKESPPMNFQHLIVHSDADGLYVPAAFDRVIMESEQSLPGGFLGSSVKLKTELEELAKWLELDLSLDIESDQVWDLPEHHGTGEAKHQRFGIESFTCIRLHRACEKSIKMGSAVVFC